MTTLGQIQINLENMMAEIDDSEEITDEQIDRFLGLRLEREVKIDGWIKYKTACKFFAAQIKEYRDRFQENYKTAQNLEKRVNERIKWHMENDRTGMAFSGKEMGGLRLQNNGRASLKIDVPLEDVTVYAALADQTYRDKVRKYLKDVTIKVIDKKLIRADLEAGEEIEWARLEKGKHVRITGISMQKRVS